jgi:hypothetical protein
MSLPRFYSGKGAGSPRFGIVTYLFSTELNLLETHFSRSSMEWRLEIVNVMIFDEYHFLWKASNDSLIPG